METQFQKMVSSSNLAILKKKSSTNTKFIFEWQLKNLDCSVESKNFTKIPMQIRLPYILYVFDSDLNFHFILLK